MLRRVIKKEEFFYDIEYNISSTGKLERGFYTRIEYDDGFIWIDSKGRDLTVFGKSEPLELKYKPIKKVDDITSGF